MTFNEADTSSFRPRLASYYARWKETVDRRAWTLLESTLASLADQICVEPEWVVCLETTRNQVRSKRVNTAYSSG